MNMEELKENPEAKMMVAPSDHLITDVPAFERLH